MVVGSVVRRIDDRFSFDRSAVTWVGLVIFLSVPVALGDSIGGQEVELLAPANQAVDKAADPDRLGQINSSIDEINAMINDVARATIPHQFDDTRKWGQTKRVWDGLKISREGLQIKTKRRWKDANHGTWKRYQVRLIDPDDSFQISIGKLEKISEGRARFDATFDARLDAFGRFSEWNRGVQLISVGVDAIGRVRLRVTCELGVKLDPSKLPPDVLLDPVVTAADLQLVEFEVERISDISGPVAEGLGRGIREILEDRLAKDRPKLVAKINRQIDKKRDKLRLSFQDLLTSKWKALVGNME